MTIPTFPARPVNGGRFDLAQPKRGRWFYEPKYNGWRALVHIPTGTMFNRHGQLLTIAGEFGTALAALRVTLDCEAFRWADCEALERRHEIGRGTLIVLDVIPEPAFAGATYEERQRWIPPSVIEPLLTHGPIVRPANDSLYQPPSVESDDAAALWQRLKEANRIIGCEFYEGLVAKRADSPYPFQLRNSDEGFPGWMKHRWSH